MPSCLKERLIEALTVLSLIVGLLAIFVGAWTVCSYFLLVAWIGLLAGWINDKIEMINSRITRLKDDIKANAEQP